jgi:hypothetical protein
MPELVAARGVIEAFHALIRGRDAAGLDAWIEAARASPAESFANGVAADRAAVAAAIETPCSNGQTEGQICRLKTRGGSDAEGAWTVMMNGMGGMGLIGFLVLIVLVLAIIALVKYVGGGRR